jgi:D-3-phosphoglycerate dehydrogenase
MAEPRVLITSFMLKPGDDVDRFLQQSGMETIFNIWHGDRTEDEMIEILRGIDGAIVSIDPFTRRVFDSTDRLKVVARTGVGYDAIDVKAATDHGVAVCIAPGTNNVAVAEFTFAMMISCARKLVENLEEVRRGGWKRHQGTDLAGSTLGIVGLGSIGKELARRARAFDMRVVAYDPVQDQDFAERYQIAFMGLEQLLRESDFVSLHLFLNEETRHVINAERLAMMKPSACLINAARGGVVDPKALYEALKERKIAGAALDVFEVEPLEADSPLRTLDNVYLYPHVAGQTVNSARAMGMTAAENVVKVIKGEKPPFPVNPEALER